MNCGSWTRPSISQPHAGRTHSKQQRGSANAEPACSSAERLLTSTASVICSVFLSKKPFYDALHSKSVSLLQETRMSMSLLLQVVDSVAPLQSLLSSYLHCAGVSDGTPVVSTVAGVPA